MLTAINTWGSASCAGLSEVRFDVTEQLALHCGDAPESSLYLNLFPNPATNYISIDMDVREKNEIDFAKQSYDNLHIILTNNTGHELARYPVNAAVERLDVSGLASGMYFITVLGNDYQSCTRRFLKL